MPYEVEVPDGEEHGVRITCPTHDESEAFQPGYRTVAFACEGCGIELEVTVHDLEDWRNFEMC